MSVQVERRHFSVIEFNRMAETGILSEDDRVELVEENTRPRATCCAS